MNVTELKKLKLQFYKQGSKNHVSAVNAVLAEIEIIEARQNKTLDELEIDSVIKKTVSLFEEQSELAIKANRDSTEFVIKGEYLKTLLPQQLTEEETTAAVQTAIVTTSSSSTKDMGKVMSYLKDEFGSSLDMKVASSKVRELLQNM